MELNLPNLGCGRTSGSVFPATVLAGRHFYFRKEQPLRPIQKIYWNYETQTRTEVIKKAAIAAALRRPKTLGSILRCGLSRSDVMR